MKKSALMALFILLMAQAAFADVLKLQPGQNSVEGVNVSLGGTATVAGRASKLTSVGAGLRSKKVAFIPVKVYVAELLVSDSTKFNRSEAAALNSLDQVSTVAIKLTFLRGVDAETVQSSFLDALDVNHVDYNVAPVSTFLDAVNGGGAAVSGKTLTIVGEKLAGGSEVITYENNQGEATSITGGAGFVKQILSIWLGTPDDDGLAALKKALIGV